MLYLLQGAWHQFSLGKDLHMLKSFGVLNSHSNSYRPTLIFIHPCNTTVMKQFVLCQTRVKRFENIKLSHQGWSSVIKLKYVFLDENRKLQSPGKEPMKLAYILEIYFKKWDNTIWIISMLCEWELPGNKSPKKMLPVSTFLLYCVSSGSGFYSNNYHRMNHCSLGIVPFNN